MNKKGIFFTLLIALLFTCYCFGQDQARTVQVVGKSSVKAIPENFEIAIPINVSDSLYEQCSSSLISTLNRIQKELKGIGLDSKVVKTLNLSILEDFYYDKGKRFNRGFRGSIRLQIVDRYSAEKLGAIVGILKKSKTPYSLDFKLSNSQIEKLNADAINSAVEDGRKKAILIAKASGVELGRILKITYDYSNYGNDYLVCEDTAEAEMAFQTVENLNLSPKEISIDKKVSIEWIINQ